MLPAVSLACALVLGGCSFAFVDGPPPPPARARCTTSPVAPVIDTAVAVVAAIGVVYFATSDDDNATLGAVVEGVLAAGFGSSAYVGWRRVARCRAAGAGGAR